MTEAEWLDCREPYDLLRHLRRVANGSVGRWLSLVGITKDRLSGRKLSLVEQAVAELLPSSVSARWSTLLCGRPNFYVPNLRIDEVIHALPLLDLTHDESLVAFNRVVRFMHVVIRDVFGNPFHPAKLDPAWLVWNGGAIVKAADAAYSEREMPSGNLDNGRLAVLADMLEEAGCTDAQILEHLRRPQAVHVRGCWVVDLLLGKE